MSTLRLFSRPTTLIVMTCLMVGAGCSKPIVDVSEIMNHHRCQKLTKGIKQVQLTDLANIRGVEFLVSPSTSSPQSRTPKQNSQDPTRNNTERNPLLFAVSNGSQPTPGYALELRDATAVKQEIELHFDWITPAPEAIMAQITTAPCIVVKISADTTNDHENTLEVRSVSAWLGRKLLGRVNVRKETQ